MPRSPSPAVDDRPWWRYPMVWLVIGGPAVVVVAALLTAVIAIRGQDPVLTDAEKAASLKGAQANDAMTPAVTARNHASTSK